MKLTKKLFYAGLSLASLLIVVSCNKSDVSEQKNTSNTESLSSAALLSSSVSDTGVDSLWKSYRDEQFHLLDFVSNFTQKPHFPHHISGIETTLYDSSGNEITKEELKKHRKARGERKHGEGKRGKGHAGKGGIKFGKRDTLIAKAVISFGTGVLLGRPDTTQYTVAGKLTINFSHTFTTTIKTYTKTTILDDITINSNKITGTQVSETIVDTINDIISKSRTLSNGKLTLGSNTYDWVSTSSSVKTNFISKSSPSETINFKNSFVDASAKTLYSKSTSTPIIRNLECSDDTKTKRRRHHSRNRLSESAGAVQIQYNGHIIQKDLTKSACTDVEKITVDGQLLN